MFLKPKELPSLQLDTSIFKGYKMEPNIDAAIRIMNQHYQKIDVAQVCLFVINFILLMQSLVDKLIESFVYSS